MKLQYWLICCALLLLLQGCIYIPTPQHALLEGRGMIEPEDTLGLQVGATTLEDILLQFGEPDVTINRQKIFVYRWTRIQGYFAVGGAGYSGYAGPIGKTTLLMFEFDSQNLLKRFEYIPEGIFNTTMEAAIKWASEESP
jgi:hypothetical protein